MDGLLVVLVVLAVAVGFVLILRRKIRALRDTVGFIKDTGAEMLATGTRMSGLIQPGDDPVDSIIDPRMATVGLACLVLDRDNDLSRRDWATMRDEVAAHFRTGEAQAGDMVMLSQWLVGKLRDEGDLPRLAYHAADLAGPGLSDDLEAIVGRAVRATGHSAGPALEEALSALNR